MSSTRVVTDTDNRYSWQQKTKHYNDDGILIRRETIYDNGRETETLFT